MNHRPDTSGRGWLPAGTRLNDMYEIEAGIASGGMGEIYRGHNIQTGDAVAIKMIRSDLTETDAAMTLFRKEASALNKLYDEVIVRYYGFSVDPTLKRPYMAMEFVAGRSLSEIVAGRPLAAREVCVLGARVASGLQAAHERGIIHRDVSPDNIIIPEGDVAQAKIIDFGIARQTRGSEETVIGDGLAGKYNYMSPEQLGLNGGDVRAASDIYGLGLVLVEAVTGRAIDMRGNPVELIEKRQRVPDLAHVDARLRPLIAWMLAPAPQDRPPSMRAVADWLQDAMAATADGGAIQTAAEPTVFAPASPRATSLSQPERPPPTSPSPGAAGAESASRSLRRTSSHGETMATVIARPTASRKTAPPPPPEPDEPPPQRRAPTAVEPTTPKAKPWSRPVALVGAAVAISAAAVGWWVFAANSAQDASGGSNAVAGAPIGEPARTTPEISDAGSPREKRPNLRAVDLARYLASYAGGSCFYLDPIVVADDRVVTEGFGRSIVPFEAFDAAFRARHGFEADIRLRQVTEAQCPVLDLLARTRSEGVTEPRMEIAGGHVRAGDFVAGTVGARPGSFVSVVLVRDDGSARVVTPATSVEKTALAFLAPAEPTATGAGKPDLVVALASNRALPVLSTDQTQPIAAFLQRLDQDVARTGAKIVTAARHVVVER